MACITEQEQEIQKGGDGLKIRNKKTKRNGASAGISTMSNTEDEASDVFLFFHPNMRLY